MDIVPGEYNDIESREAETGSANRGAFISQLLFSETLPSSNDASIFSELKPLVERDAGKSLEGLDRVIPALREEALDLSRNCLDEVTGMIHLQSAVSSSYSIVNGCEQKHSGKILCRVYTN